MSFISKLFGSGIKETIDGISDIADKYITTPDEKKAFVKAMEELAQEKQKTLIEAAQKELQMQVEELANSRQMNIQVQQADKASWLSKNIAYLLDTLVTIIWGGLTVYIIITIFDLVKFENKPDLAVVLGIYAGVTAQFGTVLQFHRGSSIGSKNKDSIIQNLQDVANKPKPPTT